MSINTFYDHKDVIENYCYNIIIVESNNKMRMYQLDWIRTTAIACVILCHVTELVYGGNALSFASMPIRSRLVAFSFFA